MLSLIIPSLTHLLAKSRDFINIVNPSPHKDSSSHTTVEQVHYTIAPFPHRMKKNDKARVGETR